MIFQAIAVFLAQLKLRSVPLLLIVCLGLSLVGCSLPQVSAESRLFLNLSLSPVGTGLFPPLELTNPAAFSAIAYDRQRDRLYALTNDLSLPQVYAFELHLNGIGQRDGAEIQLAVESVTPLQNPPAALLASVDGLALGRQNTAFMVNTEAQEQQTLPHLRRFSLTSGTWQRDLSLPKQYGTSNVASNLDSSSAFGLQPQQGFGALSISPDGDRLFAATQGSLRQDIENVGDGTFSYSRLLHYWIGEPESILVSEHVYPLERSLDPATATTLQGIIALDNAGHFLSLEHTTSPNATSDRLYQFVTGIATDSSGIPQLPPNLASVVPIIKTPALTLDPNHLPLQNHWVGFTMGPYLEDGSKSILLASYGNQRDTSSSQPVLQLTVLRLAQSSSRAT
ncbi:MAG TPA: esterase-like activity of phytase family protein [Stenomitos sp.]